MHLKQSKAFRKSVPLCRHIPTFTKQHIYCNTAIFAVTFLSLILYMSHPKKDSSTSYGELIKPSRRTVFLIIEQCCRIQTAALHFSFPTTFSTFVKRVPNVQTARALIYAWCKRANKLSFSPKCSRSWLYIMFPHLDVLVFQ